MIAYLLICYLHSMSATLSVQSVTGAVLLPTALAGKAKQSVVFIRPFVRVFSTLLLNRLTFEREFLLRPRKRSRSIVMSASVCASLCLSVVCVCPRGYLHKHTRDFCHTFCACYVWPWLGPPPAFLRYVMFCG